MTTDHGDNAVAAAYGGPGWSPRTATLRQELGSVWRACGVASEWTPLQAVLLHAPGAELAASADPDRVQMLQPLDVDRARAQHATMARTLAEAGVAVYELAPEAPPLPNQMFVADLLFMTPEGAILARPASTVRAGEERQVARRLADLGIPILRSVRGAGAFEGADAAWINEGAVLLGRGLRTNDEGVAQVTRTLAEMGVETVTVDLPAGAMHLMGMLRLVDGDLALAWPGRLAQRGVDVLRQHGYQVAFIPDEQEAIRGMALNFVTLGPRRIVMAAGNPVTQAFYEALGIACITVDVSELARAAGAIGCLTGILARAPVPA